MAQSASHVIFENEICELEILNRASLIFNDDGSMKKINALSSVFFKREGYYKSFGIYVTGLAKTVRFVDEFNKGKADADKFYYLLFIDSNVRQDTKLMGIIGSSAHTIPILFKCHAYMKGDYHIDLFGTLVRFFPMFDFNNNPTSIVICIDIELNDEDKRKVRSLMQYKPDGVTAAGEIHKLIYERSVPYVYAGSFCFNMPKIDHNIIIKFIKSAHTITGTGHYGKRTTVFGYGIDEMFLNSHLLPYVKQYSIIIDYQISYFLYHSLEYIADPKRSDVTKSVLKLILYDKYEPDMSTDDMLEYIDSVTYNITWKTDENNAIGERFYYVVHDLVSHNKTWIEKDVMALIDKYLQNIISATILFVVDLSTKSITDVKTYGTVYTNKLV